MEFSRAKIGFFLLCIGIISIVLKISLVNFSLPIINDDLQYALHSFSYMSGDNSLIAKKSPGWPLFLSFFYNFLNEDNFLAYSNLSRSLSIVVSTLAIIPMYLLARKFFNQKYSIVASTLLAFEPHINFRAGFGFADSLFLPLVILSIYFILNKNNKLTFLSFIFAALTWWVRPEGIIILFPITIVFFLLNKKSKELIPKYVLCIFIFILISSPFLIQRNEQFGDPLYFYYNDHLFVDDYIENGLENDNNSAYDFIEREGIAHFIDTFLINGVSNVLEQTLRLSFPYILILFPFGMLFSLRAFDQDHLYIKSNWIIFITYAAFMIIPLAVINERRFLFALLPPLIIFSVIPIQRLVEYGLSTFSFSNRQKNVFLVIILIIILLLSGLFMLRYELKDPNEEYEKMEFANFLAHDLHGIILNPTNRTFEHGYFYYSKLDTPPENFRNFQLSDPYVTLSGNRVLIMEGTNFDDIINNAKSLKAKYLLVDENNGLDSLDDLFYERYDYPFLTKIYDTKQQGMERITIKVFEINYEKLTP